MNKMFLRPLFYRFLWTKIYGKNKFKNLLKKGHIVDARNGGLLLGASHEYGGIYVYQFNADHFICDAEIEGNEYCINRFAFEQNKERILEINNYCPKHLPKPKTINYSKNSRIINASGLRKAIFMSGGFVVNARATQYYFKELESINNRHIRQDWFDVDNLFAHSATKFY